MLWYFGSGGWNLIQRMKEFHVWLKNSHVLRRFVPPNQYQQRNKWHSRTRGILTDSFHFLSNWNNTAKKMGKHSYWMISKCQSMELICYYILHQTAFILWYFALGLPLSWLSNLPIRVQPLLYVTAKALYDDKSASNSATRFSLSIACRTNTTFTLIDSFSKSKSLCQGRWHRMPECE